METHQVTLAEIGEGLGERQRSGLAARLGEGAVGAVEDGFVEVSVRADSRDDAIAAVRDAIAAAGLEEHLTFPSTTGTHFHRAGERAASPDERPDVEEPPHLERGSPREGQPAPYDEPPRDVP